MQIMCTNCGSTHVYLQGNQLEPDRGFIKCLTCDLVGEYRMGGKELFLARSGFVSTESTESTGTTTNY